MMQPHGVNRKQSNYPRYLHQGNTVIRFLFKSVYSLTYFLNPKTDITLVINVEMTPGNNIEESLILYIADVPLLFSFKEKATLTRFSFIWTILGVIIIYFIYHVRWLIQEAQFKAIPTIVGLLNKKERTIEWFGCFYYHWKS